MIRWWAFWRRTQYITGVIIFCLLIWAGAYFLYFYEPANCFDSIQNGDERGIDCGGSCTKICSFDVTPPAVLWSRAFKVADGQYNAVAYVENKNVGVGTPEINYTFSLYDEDGLITERSGTTVLPPDSVYPIFEGRILTQGRVPTQTFIEIADAELWLPADVGREQFVVESRELSDIDNKPRLNVSITNVAIEEATDVEIIATIFDVRGNALTTSRTVVPYFGGRATEDIVFTWPQPIAKTLRSCEVPTDVLLAIDLSGSMNDDGGEPPEPISSVLSAAEAFVSRIKEYDKVGLITYATEAQNRQGLTEDESVVGNLVAGLSIAPADEVGSTNTGDAIALAETELTSTRHNQNARKVLVLLTDGLANAPGEEPEVYAREAADSLKNTDTEIYTIGLGDNVNEEFLKDISSGSGYYYRAASADTVDRIYRSITAAICEDGPAVIEVIPKTGARFAPLE